MKCTQIKLTNKQEVYFNNEFNAVLDFIGQTLFNKKFTFKKTNEKSPRKSTLY